MASIRTALKKGRLYITESALAGFMSDEYEHVARMAQIVLSKPETILVNSQSVWDDIFSEDDPIAERIYRMAAFMESPESAPPLPMPPFENIWMEHVVSDLKVGNLIQRRRNINESWAGHMGKAGKFRDMAASAAAIIDVSKWGEFEESPWCIGMISYAVSDGGKYLGAARMVFLPLGHEDYGRDLDNLRINQGLVLHALSRMNCRNCELRPIAEGKHRPHKHNKVTPASVWHEIKITSVPKIQTTGRNAMGTPDAEKRAFWIRGHYADYRKGNGLFGNPKLKGVFWIPEHRKGNEELGQVIPEYTIQ